MRTTLAFNGLNTNSTLSFSLCYRSFAHFLFVEKNECLDNNGNCSQYCFNERGSYRYGCRIGYTLEENARYCKGKAFLQTLLLLETNQKDKKSTNIEKLCDQQPYFACLVLNTKNTKSLVNNTSREKVLANCI